MSTLWEPLQDKIRNKISELNYSKWFTFVRPLKEDSEKLTLGVPDAFFKDWIQEYYLDLIVSELNELSGRAMTVDIQVDPTLSKEVKEVIESAPRSMPQAIIQDPSSVSGLNPRYTFEKFVVGSGNQFAHAAAKAVADLPGGHYNPLFVYGGVGLGKTHLVSAIGTEILRKHPHLKIIYVTAENFMNEVIFGIRYDKMVKLRRKYRSNCDVLLVDDIQFLGGKERTQEEFFHTFNALLESQKQIVVTSDRFPKEIQDIEDRLRSRFEWGLIADIQQPDLETRIAILKRKAEGSSLPLPDDVAIYLANKIRSNVRELEGALIRLFAYASLSNTPITVEFADRILSHVVSSHKGVCSIESIQKTVTDYYKVRMSDMKSPRRMKSLVVPRQIAMFLCKKHVGASFPEIGEKFGGKDHTTVMHACKKIEGALKTDAQMRGDVEILEKKIVRP